MTAIGKTLEDDGTTVDPANHEYDTHDFFDALQAGNFPAVSYLKAAAFQDAHAGDSDPTDEQNFIVQVVTAVQASGDWDSTAIIFAYDDSDGWYDHQAPPIVNPSTSPSDALNGAGLCNLGAQQNVTPEPDDAAPRRASGGRRSAAPRARALRLRNAHPAPRRLAARKEELHRSHADRPDLDRSSSSRTTG